MGMGKGLHKITCPWQSLMSLKEKQGNKKISQSLILPSLAKPYQHRSMRFQGYGKLTTIQGLILLAP